MKLIRPVEKHLDELEVEALVASREKLGWGGAASAEVVRGLEEHVVACEECGAKVEAYLRADAKLRACAGKAEARGEDCPEVEWRKVAAGMLPEEQAREVMAHAARCGACGPELRAATELLGDEATAEEEKFVARLESSKGEWQRQVARQMHAEAVPPKVSRRGRAWGEESAGWPGWAWIAAAVIVIGAGAGVWRMSARSVDQLLADAYTERRTVEMRFAGAKYAPVRVQRGEGGSSVDRAPSLLKAESMIGEKLRESPDDGQWLQAKARADMLDRNYESAVRSLTRVIEMTPESVPVMTDLATAYFQRGRAEDRPTDYGMAVEYLGKALAQSPDDPVALFNRAIVYEQVFLYSQALEDWKHYLRVDPNSEWAAEARNRQAGIEEKLRRKGQQGKLIRDPNEFLKLVERGDASVAETVDAEIERYQRWRSRNGWRGRLRQRSLRGEHWGG